MMDTRLAAYGIPLLVLAATGCSSSSSAPPPEHLTDICGEPTGDAGVVAPPAVPVAPSGTGSVVLAFSHLYFGDTDRAGNASTCAWTQFGSNIDGKSTGRSSTDVCTPYPGTVPIAATDGNGGIDNSFGNNLVPIIATLFGSEFSTAANARLKSGDATTLLRLDGLGAGPDYAPLPGLGYHAALIASPRWDGTDVRDVDVASLNGGDLASPQLVLSGGYMSGRTWVGTPPAGELLLDLHIAAEGHISPPLPLSHVQITMKVDPSNASATDGVVSGILSIDDAIAWGRQMTGWLGPCTSKGLAAVETAVRQAADILHDGSNVAGQPCDAISVGLGFDATAVQLGKPVTLPPVPDSCADAGADAAGE